MNLSESFHDKAGVEVVNEITNPVHRVVPGAVSILIFQHEIQIPFSNSRICFVGKELRSAREQKGSISSGIDHSSTIKRTIGTAAGNFRGLEILNVRSCVPGNRLKYASPFVLGIEPINLQERFIDIWRSCDQRRLPFYCAVSRDPIEWITPAVLLEIGASRLYEPVQKVNCLLQVIGIRCRLIKKCKSHCVVGIGNWKPHWRMEQPASRRNERFTENHRCDRRNPHLRVVIIK